MIKGAVLGSPIAHSLSPVLHQSALGILGLQGVYDSHEVRSGDLATFLSNSSNGYDYLSLTMPLKEEVFALALECDSTAIRAQSANTLIRGQDTWRAFSTDGAGFLAALAHVNFDTFGAVLILGAGGTARSICASLDGLAQHVDVMGRSESRRSVIEAIVQKSDFDFLAWNNSIDVSRYSLVINTTPAGAADVFADQIYEIGSGLLFDVIYHPWPTRLARKWESLHGEVLSGIELLLYQGLAQLSLVTGLECSQPEVVDPVRKKLLAALH